MQSSFIDRDNNRELIEEELHKLTQIIDERLGTYKREVVKVETDPNGLDVIVLTNVSESVLKEIFPDYVGNENWKYGQYNLEGYPKMGLRKMIEGQWLFFRTESRVNKNEVVKYNNADDLANALVANNPVLEGCISTKGNKIEIVDMKGLTAGEIKMPSMDLVWDENLGVVRSTINSGYAFDISIVSSHEADRSNKNQLGEKAIGTETTAGWDTRSAERQAVERDETVFDDVKLNDFKNVIFDFVKMKSLYNSYKEENKNKITAYRVEGTQREYNFDEQRVKELNLGPKEMAQLKLCEIWINACNSALYGGQVERANSNFDPDRAFPDVGGENIQKLFDAFGKCKGMGLKQVIELMNSNEKIPPDMIRIMIYFLSQKEIASVFEIELDISTNAACAYLDSLKTKELKDQYNEMKETIDDSEDEFVITMKKQNNNRYN